MKPKRGRYDVSDLPEAQFEPGSRKQVLRNILGIKKKADIDRAEEEALGKVTHLLLKTTSKNQCMTSENIRQIHKVWLGGIYPWAGKYRKVNISKSGFMFAIAKHIPMLMDEFGSSVLKECTPCQFTTMNDVVRKIARVHVEFVLIHPFREGNGRVARLLTTLMALQADLPLLDFRGILRNSMSDYFAAVRAGVKRDYKPMEMVMTSVINQTLKPLS